MIHIQPYKRVKRDSVKDTAEGGQIQNKEEPSSVGLGTNSVVLFCINVIENKFSNSPADILRLKKTFEK